MNNPDPAPAQHDLQLSGLAGLIGDHPRTAGAALSAATLGIVYWQLILPLQEAQRGARQISMSVSFGGMALALFFYAVSIALFGWKAFRFFRPQPGESKVLPVLISLVFAALAFGAAIAVQSSLETKGYNFSF